MGSSFMIKEAMVHQGIEDPYSFAVINNGFIPNSHIIPQSDRQVAGKVYFHFKSMLIAGIPCGDDFNVSQLPSDP